MFQDEFPRNKNIAFNIYKNIYEHISVKTTIYAKLRETNNVKKTNDSLSIVIYGILFNII